MLCGTALIRFFDRFHPVLISPYQFESFSSNPLNDPLVNDGKEGERGKFHSLVCSNISSAIVSSDATSFHGCC